MDRAYSHYHHEVRNGRELLRFEQALEAEEERLEGERERLLDDPGYRSEAYQRYSYRARGMYVEQLEVWRELFGKERMLVVPSESLFADAAGTCGRVLEFLGLPPEGPIAYRRRNAGVYEPMAEQTRRRLEKTFEASNRRLGERFNVGPIWS